MSATTPVNFSECAARAHQFTAWLCAAALVRGEAINPSRNAVILMSMLENSNPDNCSPGRDHDGHEQTVAEPGCIYSRDASASNRVHRGY